MSKATTKKPTLKVVTDQQPELAIEDTPTEKTTKAFGVERTDKGEWFFITYTFNGDNLVSKNAVGPTMRAIVLDEFKIEAQRHFEMLG